MRVIWPTFPWEWGGNLCRIHKEGSGKVGQMTLIEKGLISTYLYIYSRDASCKYITTWLHLEHISGLLFQIFHVPHIPYVVPYVDRFNSLQKQLEGSIFLTQHNTTQHNSTPTMMHLGGVCEGKCCTGKFSFCWRAVVASSFSKLISTYR